ncbi:uncharacterized protein RSE6_16064 [Rhynchosporium secalis]|uniref:Uncharacterized protein n=1 Tax=Rhynchosporium secalis TaxID=38038 RepID=A0A1E1M707_RHYSE|nr:uncharacterized protein RSE6_16064 [Rhynchosporium secalis]
MIYIHIVVERVQCGETIPGLATIDEVQFRNTAPVQRAHSVNIVNEVQYVDRANSRDPQPGRRPKVPARDCDLPLQIQSSKKKPDRIREKYGSDAPLRIEDWPVGSKEVDVQISQNPNEIASTTERSPGNNDPSTSHIRSPVSKSNTTKGIMPDSKFPFFSLPELSRSVEQASLVAVHAGRPWYRIFIWMRLLERFWMRKTSRLRPLQRI